MPTSQLHSAFVLHSRPFRDTSLIIEFFSQERGRISCIAKGAKRPKSPWRGNLQAFTPLLINFYGRNELMSLKTAEPKACPMILKNKALLSGFYINELLMRLLQRDDAHPALFSCYLTSIQQLAVADNKQIEVILRNFELNLLDELGYGITLDVAANHEPIQENMHYIFNHEQGFIPTDNLKLNAKNFIFPGEYLLYINKRDFSHQETLGHAKRLLRYEISELLGDKPLNSRQLFQQISN